MNTARRLTRYLALGGMALMLASYPLYKLGVEPELYPFFYWRLYSAPASATEATTHRIYTPVQSTEGEGVRWQRHPIEPTSSFSRRGYMFLFRSLVNDALADSLGATEAPVRLAAFVQHVVPDAPRYRIVEERFAPLDLLHDPTRYDTTTVLLVDPAGGATRYARRAE